MLIYNNFYNFKIISFKERIHPSAYSDTTIIKEPNLRTDETIKSIFIDGIIPDSFPQELQIDLTRFCSNKYIVNRYLQGIQTSRKPLRDCLNCSFPQQDLRSRMSLTMFRSIIEKFSSFGGQFVFFSGGGEPGDYTDFIRALEVVSSMGLEFGFNTNGRAIYKLNGEPDDKLTALYGDSSKSRTQYLSLSVHDLDNLSIFDQMKILSDRLKRLGLNVHLRTSFLVYPNTTEDEAIDFLVKSRLYGAVLASFKPAYSFDPKQKLRLFGRNQEIFDTIRKLTEIHSCPSFTVNAPRLDRLRSDFEPSVSQICFAPLEKVYVNVFGQVAMCCDRKDNTQGNIPPAIIAESFPDKPEIYYRKALKWMLLFRDWQNCVLGCNHQDFNTKSYEYVRSLPKFQQYIRFLDLTESDIEIALMDNFRSSK